MSNVDIILTYIISKVINITSTIFTYTLYYSIWMLYIIKVDVVLVMIMKKNKGPNMIVRSLFSELPNTIIAPHTHNAYASSQRGV